MSYSLDQLGANWPNLIIGWVAFIKAPHLSCSQLLELQHLLWCHSKAFIYKLQPIATFFLLMRPLSGFEFETHALSSDSNLLANIRLILILEYRRTSLYAEIPIHENTVIAKSNKVRPCVRQNFPNFLFSRVSEKFGCQSSEFFGKKLKFSKSRNFREKVWKKVQKFKFGKKFGYYSKMYVNFENIE